MGVEYFSWLRGHYGLSGAISGIRESQNLPLLNFLPDFEEDRENGRQVVPNIKVEDESQESLEIQHNSAGMCHINQSPQQRVQQQQHQDPYQPNTSQSHHSAGKQNHNINHSGQSSGGSGGGGRNTQQRGNRKDHTSKNSLKKHNQYHGKHQSGEGHGKNGGQNQNRDSSDAGHKAEMVSPSVNSYFDLSPGIGTRFDGDFSESMYAVPPPYYGPLDGEQSSSNLNPYAAHQPYYNSSQGELKIIFKMILKHVKALCFVLLIN